MTTALGRFFTEEEVDAFQIYIQNSAPDTAVHIEPLSFPLDVSYLHYSEIEYKRQTCWFVIGGFSSSSSFSLDISGSVMNEAGYSPSLWEKQENWIKGETDWYRKKPVGAKDEKYINSDVDIAEMTFEEISSKWVNLREGERAYFIFRYKTDCQLGSEDVKIIEFIIANATPFESCALPPIIIRLTDKKLALKLLQESLNRIQLEDIEKGKTTGDGHYRAMVYLHDPDAITSLKTRLSEMMENQGLYAKGHFSIGRFVNCIAQDFIIALTALCRLEPKEENMKLLKGFVFHPNETVAQMAAAYWKDISGPEQPCE